MTPTIWFSRGLPDHLAGSVDGYVTCGPDPAERPAAHAAIAASEPYDEDVLAGLPNLKVIARSGIGVDAIDLDAATRRGVLVTNTPDAPTVSTAEHTIALMMAVAKSLNSAAERLRSATGNYIADHHAMELDGRTLGLVGCGRIGAAVKVMAEAIGMTVLISDPVHPDSIDLGELLDRSDVLSLHVPATPTTIGMIGAPELARLSPGSIVVNCARGPVVETDALVASLQAGHLMGAGLDTTDPEPLPPDHPLLHMPNVIVTPHIASSTVAGRRRLEAGAFEQAAMALRGERPTHLVNVDVWSD
jgi:phosphoglycerate dehydrogenase-like enzyme